MIRRLRAWWFCRQNCGTTDCAVYVCERCRGDWVVWREAD